MKEDNQVRKVGDIEIDFNRQKAFHIISFKEKDLNLTAIELKIFSILTKRLEQVYSRDQLMTLAWGDTFISARTIDSHIAHLRQKIESTKVLVNTSKNFGYLATIRK